MTASSFYAYMFDSESLIELPIDTGYSAPDIDGLMAVWWEGDYNEDTGEFSTSISTPILFPMSAPK